MVALASSAGISSSADVAAIGQLFSRSVEPVQAVPRILLFDDDLLFLRTMERLAKRHDIPLKAVAHVEDLRKVASFDFDMAILDFDLGGVTGVELAEYVSAFAGEVAIMMVSYAVRTPTKEAPWPRAIRRFALKDKGPLALLEEAVEVYNLNAHSR